MNLAPTESLFQYSKSFIVYGFEKLSTENRYLWRVWVNTSNIWRFLPN
jgi:hypothetical protein